MRLPPRPQVTTVKDERGYAALFLYRKIPQAPTPVPQFMAGPPMNATDAVMTVRAHSALWHVSMKLGSAHLGAASKTAGASNLSSGAGGCNLLVICEWLGLGASGLRDHRIGLLRTLCWPCIRTGWRPTRPCARTWPASRTCRSARRRAARRRSPQQARAEAACGAICVSVCLLAGYASSRSRLVKSCLFRAQAGHTAHSKAHAVSLRHVWGQVNARAYGRIVLPSPGRGRGAGRVQLRRPPPVQCELGCHAGHCPMRVTASARTLKCTGRTCAGTPERAAVAAGEPEVEQRLWLYGTVQAAPGLVGLFRTARTEPLGERLRMICDITQPGPGGDWSLAQMPLAGAPRARAAAAARAGRLLSQIESLPHELFSPMALHQHCCTLRAAFTRLAELRVHAVLARNGGTAAMQGGGAERACMRSNLCRCMSSGAAMPCIQLPS